VLVSAEIRWFWQKAPDGLVAWFQGGQAHPFPAGGGATPRTDLYRRDASQTEVGIKLRGNKPGWEVKGLVARLSPLADAPFTGEPEVWTKWTVDGLAVDARDVLATTKLRWIRKLAMDGETPREVRIGADEQPVSGEDAPDRGCQVELTQVVVGAETWWTLGFEAFGALSTVEGDLRAAASTMAGRRPPPLGGGRLAGYPAWLKDRAAR
jgi:hypothetical protein